MHSDYIIRIIERFAKALAAIITARKAQRHDEAFFQIQHASQLYLENDILELIKRAPKELLATFRDRSGNLDTEKCLVCGDLFYEMACITEGQGMADLAVQLKMKCLYLYTTALQTDKRMEKSINLEKIDMLKKELSGAQYPDWLKTIMVV